MSRHIAPHRWARAEGVERAKLDRHAATCARCAAQRDRVVAATRGLGEIRGQSAPDLGWDHIRARIHWSVSSERRKSAQHAVPGRRFAFVTGALALAGVTAVGGGVYAIHSYVNRTGQSAIGDRLSAGSGSGDALPSGRQPTADSRQLPASVAVVGLVDRISGDVTIDGAHAPDADMFARRIVAGDTLATGDGKLDVQFGDASAFALGPHSQLALRRFDGEAIELAIERGTVDITVAPRAKGQRFLVHAASGRDIEVRGTQFRVVEDGGATRVSCRHGLVAVRDTAGGQVEVAGERGVTIGQGKSVGRETTPVAPLSREDLATLVAATPYVLPVWTGADALAGTTAPLALVAAGEKASHRDVRVDGIELGVAPLRVRVLPGRHTVEAGDATGHFRRIGWVDVALGALGAAHLDIAHLDIPAERPADPGLRERQFDAKRDTTELEKCTRQIRKTGLTDTYVRIEISVDAAGAINMLNVLDTDLSETAKLCVKAALENANLGTGPSSTWTEKIEL